MTDALALLHRCLTPAGFVAAPDERANYRRVWARDGVVCGLAGLASGNADLTHGLQATLHTLADRLGPDGQIPSNAQVTANGTGAVSYGGLAGRVDAGLWFILGVALLARQTGDRALAVRFAPAIARVRALLRAWEFNARGLIYVPQSGDWADEYDLHGYLLFDQALRLLALRTWAPLAADDGDTANDADRLAARIEATYWPQAGGDAEASYHPDAYRTALEGGEAPFPYAALGPGGYTRRFDALGSAVAVLAGLWPDRRGALLDHALGLAETSPSGLVPAFDPIVQPGDAGWEVLLANTRDTFSNRPGHYHNGGAWPMVNGWWVAAFAHADRTDAARALADALVLANDARFPEYLDAETGAPHGTTPLAWSAAGEILARAALDNHLRDWWTFDLDPPEPPAFASTLPDADAEVIVAGEILVDLLSTEPVDSLRHAPHFERHAGGSAANLATNLARLGVPTTLVATVGNDGFGQFLRESASPTGVTLKLRAASESPTSVVVVTRTSGTPDFAIYRHADRLIRPSQLPDCLLRRARLLHTSGFALSREPGRTTLLGAASRAANLGVTLSIDLNVAPRSADERTDVQATTRAFLALDPLVKVSSDDAERLFGERLADADVIARLREWGARLVCLTRGAGGTHLWWHGGSAEVPAAPVQTVVDATGAGDAFWAGFVAAWLGDADPVAAAQAGGRLAALKLGRVGRLPDQLDMASVVARRGNA